jgi:hypothetical protein
MPMTSSTTTTMPMTSSTTTIRPSFNPIIYQTGIIQTEPLIVSLKYEILLNQQIEKENINSIINFILNKINAIDIKYSTTLKDDTIFVYLTKKSIETFETSLSNTIKNIIFVFNSDTKYLIEPLLKMDLSIKNKASNNTTLIIIMVIVIIMGN